MSQSILVIEDNEQNMYLMRFLLEKNGFNVLQSLDGLSGIQMAHDAKPDLILLDIQLPGMNGYEVASELTKASETKDIPIVAVTSYAMAGDREKALASGCTGYIEKPIDPETFVQEIKRFLS